MAEPFVGEVRLASFGFAPPGWALCQGQIMPISSNQALYSLLGVRYGGDGRTTFGLPNLQTRVPLQTGAGYPLGAAGGESQHQLTISEMPLHTHQAMAAKQSGDNSIPTQRMWGVLANNIGYATGPQTTVTMSSKAMSTWGGGVPHENQSPYLVLNFMIALMGIYPTRD
jgi:microcystin-dependent protein